MKRDLQRAENPLKQYVLLNMALLVYLVLALSGIRYGLPHGDRLLSYNPDETTWMEALSRIRPGHLNPAPVLITPTGYLEMYGAAVGLARITGYIPHLGDKEWYRTHPEKFARFYSVGRYLQVLFALLMLMTVWSVSRQVFSLYAANITVLLLSITPSLVAASHFSQANVPVAALASVSLGALLLDSHTRRINPGWLWLGALFCGVAIGTKYSAMPLLLPVAYQSWERRASPSAVFGVLVGLVAGLFMTCPFAFIDPASYLEGFKSLADANLEPISGFFAKLITPFRYPFRFALGGVLETLCAVAFFAQIKERGPVRLLVLWISGFFAGVLFAGDIASPGRVLIVLPALIMLVGKLFHEGWAHGLPRRGLVAAVTLLYLVTGVPTVAIVRLRHQIPVQQQAEEWIMKNIPVAHAIGVPRSVYWWTPDVLYASASHPERMAAAYPVVNLKYSKQIALTARPDYILVSEREREGCYRWPEYAATCGEFFNWLETGGEYTVVQNFPRRIGLLGWHWKRPEIALITDDDLWQTSLTLYQKT
jgi:hypothetical protein